MGWTVEHTGDARAALAASSAFLEGDPVRNNVLLTLLGARATSGGEGRYWLVRGPGDGVGGVAFQSPLDFRATTTAVPPDAVAGLAAAMAAAAPGLPGLYAEAATAAALAGAWTEATRSAAVPTAGQRIYEAPSVDVPTGVTGGAAGGDEAPRGLLVEWFGAFADEVGERRAGADEWVGARVAAGLLHVWVDAGEPVAMCATTVPLAGVTRVQGVYTPPGRRARGYAGALVATVSARALEAGVRPILYTDLANPTSNSVYRRIGYRAVAEVVGYRFVPAARRVGGPPVASGP